MPTESNCAVLETRRHISRVVLILLILVSLALASNRIRVSHEPLPTPRDVSMGFAISKYPDFPAYEAELVRLKSTYPDQFEFQSEGTSYDGSFPLTWVTVGNPTKPAILFVGVLHGRNEWAGTQMLLQFAEKLLDPRDNQRDFNRAFLERYCLVAIPMANPWGYFASPEGIHHNPHPADVKGIESADWHDMTHYGRYMGVDLNRNFDWNWDKLDTYPWVARKFWNGKDYGIASRYMMPYYRDAEGNEVYSPDGEHKNRILKPDPGVYDYKGEAPFSEPETQLVRDLVLNRYNVIGFADWHTMNPWQNKSATYVSGHEDTRAQAYTFTERSIDRVNNRNPDNPSPMPKPRRIVIEEYANNGPYAANWAQNAAGIRTFGWETGTALPDKVWTDAYMDMFYHSIHWMTRTKPTPR
ncbi:MAG: hypothetical protein ACI8W3_000901 [Myxococcota bacterium]|jgi:hypothetical protein